MGRERQSALMSSQTSQLYDRVYGCLLGMAAGDALGEPCRDLDWRSVQERYGTSGEFQPWTSGHGDARERPAGYLGDLARLAVRLADRSGRTSSKPGIALLIDELFDDPGIESLPAQAAMARIRAGIEPSRSAVPELAGPDALYLAVPIGIANIGDHEAAFLAARVVAGPILLGPSLEAGQVFAAAVAMALMPGSSPRKVLDAAVEIAPPSVAKVLKPAALFAKEHLGHPPSMLMPAIHDRFSSRSTTDSHGPALESLAVALMITFVADGLPEPAVASAASYGGWSHATAAATGALTGAMSGISQLPASWLRSVKSANPDLSPAETAGGLCSVILNECERQRGRLDQLARMSVST